MKSHLGKTLRKIRVGKHVSLNAVADEYLSKSQISRFERGESEISCTRLINSRQITCFAWGISYLT